MSTTPTWFQRGLDAPGLPAAIEVAGARICYETWGEPGRPGVVLIHGSNAHRHWWRFVAPLLADQFHVAALDLSGNGDSDHRPRYDAATLAAEVWGVCQAALGPRPFVIGHSFGGFVALETAYRYGADLAGVILNDFTVQPPETHTEWGLAAAREGRSEPRRLRVYPELEQALGRFRLIPEQPTRHPIVIDWLARQSLRQVEGGWTWKFDPALFDHLEMGADQRDKFAALACRSAVVVGELSGDDGAQHGEYMREISAGALPLISIPDTHHHMMFEEPVALAMAFKGLLHGWLAEDGRPAMREALGDILALTGTGISRSA